MVWLLLSVATFGAWAAELPLRGTVLASERSVVLSGARVTVSGPGLLRTVVTDAQGAYEFTALPAGSIVHISSVVVDDNPSR